jgi:hypothetical protein
MTYSTNARRNLLATSADEPMLELVEITHPDLEIPIRVVNDTQDITVEGNEFIACPFSLTRPDDVDQQAPTAKLSVDNIGRELTHWLEHSRGGKGARCRLMAVLRSQPDVIEFDMTMDLSGLSINNMTVDGELGFQNTLMQPAVTMRYDPISSPGLF